MAAPVNTVSGLGQYAVNVALAVQSQITTGQEQPLNKGNINALCGAIVLLGEALVALNNSTAAGGTIPNSLLSGRYSSPYSATAPIVV